MRLKPLLAVLSLVSAAAFWAAAPAVADDDRCPSGGQLSSGSWHGAPVQSSDGDRGHCPQALPAPAVARGSGEEVAAADQAGQPAPALPPFDLSLQPVPTPAPTGAEQPVQPAHQVRPVARVGEAPAAWTVALAVVAGLGLLALVRAGFRARRRIVGELEEGGPGA